MYIYIYIYIYIFKRNLIVKRGDIRLLRTYYIIFTTNITMALGKFILFFHSLYMVSNTINIYGI